MPELPEVETVRRGLAASLGGRRLSAVVVRRRDFVRAARGAWAELEGARVSAVERAGKYLIVNLEGERRWQLMLHLGMTGSLRLHPAGTPPGAHTHVIFSFDDIEVHFQDPRRFGRVVLAAAPAQGFAPRLGVAAGAEPLEIGAGAFAECFRGREAPIKNALLNQKLLRGVGNIYADESLYRAGIHPCARRLSRPRLERLRLALREVLGEAIAAGGSSISDYVDAQGEPGWFHLEHRVYGRAGEPCRGCGTPIRRRVLAGRSAHFCPRCQRR